MEVVGEIAVAVGAVSSPSLPFVELPISLIYPRYRRCKSRFALLAPCRNFRVQLFTDRFLSCVSNPSAEQPVG
jgi:hypothetical protein